MRTLCGRLNGVLDGRKVHRVQGGPGWVRILLTGEDRLSVLLTTRPGCALDLLWQGRLPDPIHALLETRKDHPLVSLLAAHTFVDCRVLKHDRIVCLRLTGADGQAMALLHQVFGTKGNVVLLSAHDQLLWAEHRPPHSLLTRVPASQDLADTPPDASLSTTFAPDDQVLDPLAEHLAEDLARKMSGALQRRLQTGQRLVENLARDLATAEQGDEFRRKAEALASHLHEITPGLSHCRVTDPRDGTLLDIELDPALKPSANLTAWFKRATKADKGRAIIAERLTDARRQWQADTEDAASLQNAQAGNAGPQARLEGLLTWGRAHPECLPTPGDGRRTRRSPYGPDQPARPFRRYRLEDRWEVWIGRDGKENDMLTHRTSHLQDIWLHAQGVPGSHVILRTAGRPDLVPPRVVAKAASLAALFSKARHAGLVPVIWTERRYVRKPRKGAPGLAICLREKSIMVKPEIGPGVVPV